MDQKAGQFEEIAGVYGKYQHTIEDLNKEVKEVNDKYLKKESPPAE